MFPPIIFTDVTAIAFLLNGVKIIFYVGFLAYIIFAFIALRQIEEMRRTVVTPFSSIVLVLGIAHLLFAIGALAMAFLTLG